ncbi:AAA family ATPase [Vibrio astriarenae]|uniref:AAA family ATPase n=1 Tax=Vibrio astriarenae TaxID=1481923 RepID=A0A7Z2T490_9VIBR|nr:AAA family ATPase [Vibrio astriarenae]QIA64071.1 AAA family ATPase [Vibrio astriarenae]
MGEAVKITREQEERPRLRTNLVVWVFYMSETFVEHITEEMKRCDNLHFETVPLMKVTLLELSKLTPPDVIFVETGLNWAQKIVELQNLDKPIVPEGNEASLIVFGDEDDNSALRIALKLGASDFISSSSPLMGFYPILKGVAEDKISRRNMGEFIVFINSKGGSGASTLALNSALEIATHHPDQVLLLDLDLQFGVIEDYLNITSSYSLADAIAQVGDIDESSLGGLVTKHDSGLHVLAFNHDNPHDNYEKAHQIKKLLPVLREYYLYVIVDLSRGMDRLFASVIAPATKSYIVAQQNLVSIKSASRIVKQLSYDFGISKDQVEIVVNRYEKKGTIGVKDMEETINGVKLHLIPNDFKVAIESANLGKSLFDVKNNSAVSKGVKEFAHTMMPEQNIKKSWIKRLFS